jgi:hypothetical protein
MEEEHQQRGLLEVDMCMEHHHHSKADVEVRGCGNPIITLLLDVAPWGSSSSSNRRHSSPEDHPHLAVYSSNR